MMITTDVKYENLDCYILNDQPTICGICGSRTDFEEINVLAQLHECLNTCCGYKFLTESKSIKGDRGIK